MTTQICLRCDWKGTTRGDRCPECAAPLFTSGDAGAPTPRATAAGTADVDQPLTELTEGERGPRAWAAISALVVSLIVALILFQLFTVDPEDAADVAGDQGILIFTERHDDGNATLWAFDLERGELHRGPDVRSPVALVDAYLAEKGWVGVTSQVGDEQRASVYRWFGPEALDIVLAQGTFAAWTSGGLSVAAVRSEEPGDGGCDILVVSTGFTSTQQVGERYRSARCADPVALGRSGLNPYVTLAGARADATYEIENAFGPRVVARDAYLLGVGQDGDLLLGVVDGGTRDPADLHRSFEGLLVGDARLGGLRSVTAGVRPLVPERFLAFSFDGEAGYVLGSVGDRRGIWEVALDIGDESEPRFVLGAGSEEVWFTASFDRTVGLVDGALLSSTSGEDYVPLELPEDAPPVSGPILLVRSLPYSAP